MIGKNLKNLHGVGRRIKLKPIWREGKKPWATNADNEIEEDLIGLDAGWCLVNEGQWVYDGKDNEHLEGFGRSIRADRK